MVALDRDNAIFCFLLVLFLECQTCRRNRSIFWGLDALSGSRCSGQSSRERGGHRPRGQTQKIEIARAIFTEVGLGEFIDLREGDLKQTHLDSGCPVGYLLVDIWNLALPAHDPVSL